MTLDVLNKEDVEKVRQWRNENLVALRTPFPLTTEMQQDFYESIVCNRDSNHRYWAVKDKDRGVLRVTGWQSPLVGMVGLTDISLENRDAEISLIIDPDLKGNGYGTEAVRLVLEQAFNYLNLDRVCGECYYCNPVLGFWRKMAKKYKAKTVDIPDTRFWESRYWPSYYFVFRREDFK